MSVDLSHQHTSRGAPSSAARAPSSNERVVVVGGGFAGRSAVRLLSRISNKRNAVTLHITLIDRAPSFEFTPGVLRCIVDPTRLYEIIAPHAAAIEPCATFVHGCVTDIQDGQITFVSSLSPAPQTLHFDYCVWATGSSYTFPIDSHPGTLVLDHAERQAQLKGLQTQLMSSKLYVAICFFFVFISVHSPRPSRKDCMFFLNTCIYKTTKSSFPIAVMISNKIMSKSKNEKKKKQNSSKLLIP